ncbi:Tetratricopeptide TPR_2 repeat-containing protein (fragment) [uncultured delta proteobacterium]|uniref:Tetratricopeptide TPR_2 repeat-containing protein n=1 Tax=uncultured delta proteobacterium TaxID=34034 RepID=A0A212ITG4_9DELT
MAIRTGLSRALFSLAIVAGLWVHDGIATTVGWEVLPDRDRVTVKLNQEEGFAGDVTRVSRTGLLLDLGVPTAGMGQEHAPENAKFFAMSEPRGRALGFFMKTAAFGFVVTRPDRHTVIINAFADPLGERWTPQGLAAEPQPEETPPPRPQPATATTPSGAASAALPPSAPGSAVAGASPTDVPGVVRGRIGKAQPGTPEVTATEARASALPPPEKEERKPADLHASRPGDQNTEAPGGKLSPLEGRPGSGTTTFRSRINPGSSADWDDMQAAQSGQSGQSSQSEQLAQSAQPEQAGQAASKEPSSPAGTSHAPQPAAAGKTEHAPAAAKVPEKIYVDKDGKPVPPPPDAAQVLSDIRADMAGLNFKGALEKVESLLQHPELTREQTEEVLHLYSEMLFVVNQGNLAEKYDAITSATVTAMNYNPDSPRNAAAYLRLGYINLKVGNTVEASAYFTRLRRQYPRDESIPLTYYYWGEYYYGRNEMQQAADEFQYIISNYSGSKYARDAAVGLARAYSALGYFQEAYDIIDYIDRRWPRLYLESPPVLELMGDVGYRLGNLDFALERYMIYYNLMPDGPTADVILTRIGDVFARQRQLAPAKEAYTRAETLFPDRDGGLVAMMRLAETGINDAPELATMMTVFQGTRNFKTADIYRKIIKDHPSSELVPLAQLKLAMWYLANNRYEDALAQCTELAQKFPKHELVPRAEEVAMKAFSALAAESAQRNRSGQVLANWQNNPLLQKQEESMPTESRLALANSMWQQRDPDGALKMIAPMFLGAKDPQYSEQALLLALIINLDNDQWEAIEKLGEQVALWELTAKARLQLDYALALSRENLGKSREAEPLWSRVAATGKLDEKQQAYAEYFLAKDAENDRKLQDAYTYGRSALNRFLAIAQKDPQHADTGKINSLLSSLMDISETSGRFAEALDYANRYMANLAPADPQRQGLLFRIAGIYRKQGNTPEWRKALQQLAEQYPDSVHGRAAASTLRSSRLTEDAAQFAPGGQL